MLRKDLIKANFWKVLFLIGSLTGYAVTGFNAQSKLQQEQVTGAKSESMVSNSGKSKEPGILLRSIFNLVDF